MVLGHTSGLSLSGQGQGVEGPLGGVGRKANSLKVSWPDLCVSWPETIELP